MKILHTLLRLIIFVSALVASTAVLMTFLTKIPNNPVMIPWAQFLSVFLELSAAFVLSLGLAYLERKEKKAYALFGIYAGYVFIACLASVFLFMTELNQKDIVAQKVNTVQAIAQNKYDMAKADYDRWDKLMTVEQNNVKPGWKFDSYEKKRDAAKKEMDEASLLLNDDSKVDIVINNIQSSFSAIFPKAWKALLVIIFCIIMGFVYIMQVITTWPFPLPELPKNNSTSGTVTDNPDNVTPYPYLVTHDVTDVTKCACGCGNPHMPNSKYYSNACKTRNSRNKKAEEEMGE